MSQTAREIYEQIKLVGAELFLRDGTLKVRPASRVPAELMERVKECAPALRAIVESESDVAVAPPPRCWFCNHEPTPPSYDDQADALQYECQKRPPIFHQEEHTWQRFRALLPTLLAPGEVLGVCVGWAPEYSSIVIRKVDGSIRRIPWKDFADS